MGLWPTLYSMSMGDNVLPKLLAALAGWLGWVPWLGACPVTKKNKEKHYLFIYSYNQKIKFQTNQPKSQKQERHQTQQNSNIKVNSKQNTRKRVASARVDWWKKNAPGPPWGSGAFLKKMQNTWKTQSIFWFFCWLILINKKKEVSLFIAPR